MGKNLRKKNNKAQVFGKKGFNTDNCESKKGEMENTCLQ